MNLSLFQQKVGMVGVFFVLVLMIACNKSNSTHVIPPDDSEPISTGVSERAVVTLTSDVNGNGGPDITYKRGIATGGNGGFFYNDQQKASIDAVASAKMPLLSGIRNLYK
jgi:hypothetical protein